MLQKTQTKSNLFKFLPNSDDPFELSIEIIPQTHVDSHVFDDINELLDNKDIDQNIGDDWKDGLTKFQKFKK